MRLGFVSLLAIAGLAGSECIAFACGGLFCDSANVPQPPSQSSERVIFELQAAGHDAPPAGLE